MKRLLKRIAACLTILLFLISTGSAETAKGNDILVEAITLSEQKLVIVKGKSANLKAKVEPANAKNKRIEWKSTNETVATVKDGQVRGLKNGKCDIICKAKDESGAEAVCHVEVGTPAKSISLSEKQITLCVGGPEEAATTKLAVVFKPDDTSWKEIKWSSSDETIATVDSEGVVKALAKGQVTITAETMDPNPKKVEKCRVTIGQAVTGISLDQEEYHITSDKGITIKATIEPTNAVNKKLIWVSADENIAKVDEKGIVRGAGEGETTITATAADGSGATATCKVSVLIPVKKISIGKTKSIDIPVGVTIPFKVTVDPVGASVKGLKWESSNEEVATVDDEGKVTVHEKGSVTISAYATDGSNLSASVACKADKYDVVFLDSKPQKFTYDIGSGLYKIKAKAKNGRVKISGIGKGSVLALIGDSRQEENATATPLKPGTDLIVISAGAATNHIRVYISPFAFD